jgi:lipopolysaccharide export system permease protein
MRLLNRYILTTYARVFFLSLAAFAGLYLLIDFFERVDDFIEHQARFSLYLLYFLNKIPLIVTQVTPLAVLMGVFMTLGGLSRTNELTAMRASGLSLIRITLPLVGTAFLTALIILITSELLVPVSARKINFIFDAELRGRQHQIYKRDNIWFREGDTIVHVRLAQPEAGRLQRVTFFRMDEEFHLSARTDARQGEFSDGNWVFEDLVIRSFTRDSGEIAATERLPSAALHLAKTPEDFKVPAQKNIELGFRDLYHLSRRLQAEGHDAIRYRVDMHSRLATPFASLIMAFLGIPFALQKGRGSGLAMGIAISVAIGAGFHIINAIIMALGYSAVVPPLFAAWAANLLFGLFGLWLLLSVRQ